MTQKAGISGRRLVSPLRYPGSKRRLISYVEESLSLNNLKPKLYVESFAGGASIALQLMEDNLVEKVVLVDLDPMISSFWKSVFFDTEWLVAEISKMKVSIHRWHFYKKLKPRTIRDHALKCLFLNRTSFSGILQQGAGPIGGLKQDSEYLIDCRFPKDRLIDRINKISLHKEKIFAVWNCSWSMGLSKVAENQRKGNLPSAETFFYFDPPFIKKADRLYKFFFNEEKHQELRDFLVSLKAYWMLSYDSANEVESLYKDAIEKEVNGTKKEMVEILYSIASTGARASDEIVLSNLPLIPSSQALWSPKNQKVALQVNPTTPRPLLAPTNPA